ncbi:MAG: cell division protein FtsL [Methylophilaceae bacterium]|nr:cell division protein FtsL [Methylophilaceae bacterium]
MTRLNILLFLALILMALGTVTSQHKARKLYIELQQQKDSAKQYAIEYGQLKLEQSTWAMHSRVEEVAGKKLQMQVPDSKRVQVVTAGASVVSKEPVNAGEVETLGSTESQQINKSNPEQ